jgi:hypothetical protein
MKFDMPLQIDQPLFVKVPFDGSGRSWKIQEHFPWKEMGVDYERVKHLYAIRFLYHNEELAADMKVGDGLETLDLDGLTELVNSINKKVKAKTTSELEFNRKKCKKSKILDKQRGLIRSWRRNYGELEV